MVTQCLLDCHLVLLSPSSMTISLLTGRQVFSHVIGHGQSAEICLIYPIADLHDVDQLNDVIFGYQKGI